MSPGNSTATSPNRTSSTIESSFRTRTRSQSGGGGWTTTIEDPAQIESITFDHSSPVGANLVGGQTQSVERTMAGDRHPFPDLTRREITQHCGHPADVIRVTVGERHRIEPPHPQSPQRGGDDA